jgi:hypothetical protein
MGKPPRNQLNCSHVSGLRPRTDSIPTQVAGEDTGSVQDPRGRYKRGAVEYRRCLCFGGAACSIGINPLGIKRQTTLAIGGSSLTLPAFFPSISSIKTNLRPLQYLEFLVTCAQPHFLISAYDIANCGDTEYITDLLSRAVQSGQIVLMDSGNYEAFWMASQRWRVTAFHEALAFTPHHLSFGYDNQSPPDTAAEIAEDVTAGVLRDQGKSLRTIVPIVHGGVDVLPETIRRVAEKLFPIMIAVPERALGNGILRRAATVCAIRAALNQAGLYIPLHLLGTGNPVSILIYALAGADSFDGLEWCQTVVDHHSGRLHHFQHWDFFADQSNLKCDGSIPYVHSVLVHNLAFYGRFLMEVAQKISSGEGDVLARQWLSDQNYEKVMPILEGRPI